jgi:hypothetical protein
MTPAFVHRLQRGVSEQLFQIAATQAESSEKHLLDHEGRAKRQRVATVPWVVDPEDD